MIATASKCVASSAVLVAALLAAPALPAPPDVPALSKQSEFTLVERESIARVVDELVLSAALLGVHGRSDDLLFFPFCANDACGIRQDWPEGAACHGQSIHRIGEEFVVYDAYPTSRLKVIRHKKPPGGRDPTP